MITLSRAVVEVSGMTEAHSRALTNTAEMSGRVVRRVFGVGWVSTGDSAFASLNDVFSTRSSMGRARRIAC